MKNSKFDKVLDAIEADLQTLAKSAGADLAKVHPGEETPSEGSPDVSATAPEGSAPPPGLDAPPPADAGGPPPGPPADAVPPGPPGEGAPGEEQMPSHEELVQALSQLPPEQLAAYKAAIDEVMGQGGSPEASASASPPAPPPPEMGKSEDLAKAEQMNGQIVELRNALKAVKADLAKSQDETALAAKAIESFLSQPNRRSLVSAPETAPAVTETESLSKSEITQRLRKASRKPSLTKAERAGINGYLFRGESLESIKHLIVGADAS